MVWGGGLGSLVGEVKGPALVFLNNVNISGMRPWSRLSSQPLTIPAPWVLRVRWSIILVPGTLGDCLPFPCGEKVG